MDVVTFNAKEKSSPLEARFLFCDSITYRLVDMKCHGLAVDMLGRL